MRVSVNEDRVLAGTPSNEFENAMQPEKYKTEFS